MNPTLRSALGIAGLLVAAQASAQVTFYQDENFQGRAFTTQRAVGNFQDVSFNDRASSVLVTSERWEVCEDASFSGRCVVLRPGRYPSLASMGLNDRVSSVRTVGSNARIADDRYAPAGIPVYDSHRRQNERLYEANVTSVRAVVGPASQRCWVEREHMTQEHSGMNVPAALAGAVVGGVLGHQIGGGRGNDIATAGGAVAGAAMGAHMGRSGSEQQGYSRDVERCASYPEQARADYWDVTYSFRGEDHRVQLTSPPGSTMTVNGRGEPRA